MNYSVKIIGQYPYYQFSVRSLKKLCAHICIPSENNLIYDRSLASAQKTQLIML